MLKTAAIIFGIVFLLVGVLGFVPGITTTGQMLLGIFHVSAVLITGLTSTAAARTYFRVFGIIYALVAILGFFTGDGLLLGLISHNTADMWLHVLIAIVALALGFAVQDAPENSPCSRRIGRFHQPAISPAAASEAAHSCNIVRRSRRASSWGCVLTTCPSERRTQHRAGCTAALLRGYSSLAGHRYAARLAWGGKAQTMYGQRC
jgi:uncharacterized protein DUF4383